MTPLQATLRELIAWGETQTDEGIRARVQILAANLRRLERNPDDEVLKMQTLKNVKEFEAYRAVIRN